jgi:hypothetical protein
MKIILKKLFIFIIPIVIILSPVEYFTRKGNSLYKEKWSGYINNADSIQVLALGDSHTMYGVDPSKFGMYAYNMSFAQQSLYFDEALVLKNLHKLKNLKYVLINLSYDSFYNFHNSERDIFYHYFYGIDYKNETFYIEDISMIYAFGFKQSVRNYMIHPPYNSKKGYETPPDSTVVSSLNQDNAKYVVGSLISFENKNKKEIVNNFSNFIKALKERNITPILFSTPKHRYYNNELDKKILDANYKTTDSICKKFDIDYFDYRTAPFSDSLFYDLDHLNMKGAEKLSLLLNVIIENKEKSHLKQ